MENYLVAHEQMVCSIERLLADTEHRILSSGCVDTSNEVKRDNIYLAKKNIKEINKLEGLFYAKEGRNVMITSR